MSKLNEAIEIVITKQYLFTEIIDACDKNDDLKENLKECLNSLVNEYAEYKANKKEKIFEETRAGQLYELLKENKDGIKREKILEIMNISKGNFGSIMVYMRRKGHEAIKINGKYYLSEYVRIVE